MVRIREPDLKRNRLGRWWTRKNGSSIYSASTSLHFAVGKRFALMAARWSGAIHARRLNKCSGGSNLWHIGGEATTVRRAGNENSRASSAMRWQKRRGSIELELSACKMVFAERPAEHIHVQLNACKKCRWTAKVPFAGCSIIHIILFASS